MTLYALSDFFICALLCLCLLLGRLLIIDDVWDLGIAIAWPKRWSMYRSLWRIRISTTQRTSISLFIHI